ADSDCSECGRRSPGARIDCQATRSPQPGSNVMRHFVFDAYGTLFDVHSAASRYRDAIGEGWDRLSQLWRAKHLEYTWIHAQTNRHIGFWTLAERSLDYAIAATGGIPDGIRDKLLSAYRTLSPYPEVADVLSDLKRAGAKLAILTN